MSMSASCCNPSDPHRGDAGYRRVLWAVLAINAAMFAVEVAAGVAAGSASLQADALDFLGDAGNYAISLFVVGMALRYRAMAAFLKGATMGVFGVWVLGVTAWHVWHATVPHAVTMGAVGVAALVANAVSFSLLWAYREGRCSTCDQQGLLRVTMCLETWLCCSPHWASLAQARAGLTRWLLQSWLASHSRALGSCYNNLGRNCVSRRHPPNTLSVPPQRLT